MPMFHQHLLPHLKGPFRRFGSGLLCTRYDLPGLESLRLGSLSVGQRARGQAALRIPSPAVWCHLRQGQPDAEARESHPEFLVRHYVVVDDGCTEDIDVELQRIGCILGSEHRNDSRGKSFREGHCVL